MGRRGVIDAFFKGAEAFILAAVADIRRFLQLRAFLLLIQNAIVVAPATGAAEPCVPLAFRACIARTRKLAVLTFGAVVEGTTVGSSFPEDHVRTDLL